MANDNFKVKVQLEATTDKAQVQKEATEVADTAQKTLDKKQLKLNIEDNLTNLKKKLEETRIAYQNLLNQPMNWTTDKQLQQLEDQMEDLRNAIKEDEKALNDLWWTSNKLWWIFKNLIGKISALGVAMKVFSTLKQIFVDFQNSQKALVQATGASWKVLSELTDSMLDVQGKVRQNQQEIAEAIWELNTRLWLTWQQLTDFTTKYLKFASVTGQDSKTAIETNVKMFSIRWVSIKQQAEYLDKLTVAWQKTWISVANLTSQLQSNAPVLQELWFSLDDSIALLSNFEKAWIEASQVLQSMKMWLKNLAEDGTSPMEALNNVIEWVRNWTLWLSDVMEIFWSRWGAAMYRAIKDWTFELGNMKKALEDVSGAVEQTFKDMETWGDLFGRIWDWAKGKIAEFADDSFRNFQKIVEFNQERMYWTKMLIQWNADLQLAIDKTTGEIQWLQAVETKEHANMRQLDEAQKKYTETVKDYADSWQDAKDAVDAFAYVRVDQSATRADFDATKKKAQETVSELIRLKNILIQLSQQTIKAKQELWQTITWADMKALYQSQKEQALLIKQLKMVNDSTYQWKQEDWWSLGSSALWWGGGWSSKSKAEEMLKSFKDEFKDLYSDMDSTVNEHQKKYDDVVKKIEKVEEEYGKLKDKAQDTWESAEKSLKSYNEQLEKSQADAVTNLGQRYVELKKELIDVDSYMKKVAEDLSWKELGWMQENWTTEYRWYELKDLIELKEKLDEMKLIEENTTEEQRKSEEFTKKTSKAQEILNNLKEKELELQEKIATATEKQKIAESVMSNEWFVPIQSLTKDWEDIWTYFYDSVTGAWEKIHDADNIEYAKQLEDQMKNLDDQKSQLEQEKNEEVEILVDINARKSQLEKEYTKTFQEEVAKQKKSVEELISYWDRLIARKNEYYSSWSSARAYWWEISSAKVTLVGENWPEKIVARQSSYVQPKNASNSYSTVNSNNTNLTINWMEIWSYNSTDEMLEDLKQRLTYRS